MRHHSFVWSCVVAIGICCGSAFAQQTTSATNNSSSDDAALREKAFDLLKDLSVQIHTLQSAENRARIGSNIANCLWEHDEKQARALFVAVGEEINAALRNLPARGDENAVRPDETDENTRLVFLQLRIDTAERIAKHDQEFALSFLNTTEASLGDLSSDEISEIERGLQLRVAKLMATNNPQRALELGGRILARGFSDDLLVILRQLNRKHPEQAAVLYRQIVTRLRDVTFSEEVDTFQFATTLARSFKPPAPDGTAYRELIELFIKAAIANGCARQVSDEDDASWFCNQVGSLLPEMEAIDPTRAGRLKQWAPNYPRYDWPAEAFEDLSETAANGNIDEVLALTQKYPNLEAEIYFRAIQMALAADDPDRAHKIANNFKGNPERQKMMLSLVAEAEKFASLSEERIAEMQKEVTSNRAPRDQILFFIIFSGQLAGKNQKAALKMLDQASALIDAMKPGREQTEMQLRLAAMYSVEKSPRGLTIMESLMPRLNELVSASAKLDGYGSRYLREGEWNMTGSGTVGNLLTQLSHFAWCFARYDFDRAVSVAAQFERAELRIMALLKLAQGALETRPSPNRLFRYYSPY